MNRTLGRRSGRPALLGALVLCLTAALLVPSAASAAPPYPEVVVLVSGFNTASPFSTPDPSCGGVNGPSGPAWNPPGGLSSALRGAGLDVFTAPVGQAGKQPPAPCAGPGEPLTTPAMAIDSNGDTDDNGVALAAFLAFLRDSYGVERVHLVGHSDGGLWSRSALTQNQPYAGLSVLSFTTLGTPHTGSFVADLTVELNGGKCNFSNRVEQAICDAMSEVIAIVVDKLGPQATRELTSDYLTTWNPQQVIGACPVSGIAGDHVGFPLRGLDYYMPSDGLVGEASALAEAATDISGYPIPAPDIPDFREAGIYDVVHGTAVKILDKQNLLNTPAISAKVVETIGSGAEDCNVPAASTVAAGGEPAAGGVGSPAGAAATDARLRAPLYRMVPADRGGRLPVPGAEDFAVSKRGVSIRCGFTPLEPIPVVGDRRLRLHAPGGCDRPLQVRSRRGAEALRGSAAAPALLLRSHPRRHLLVVVRGDQLRIRVRGAQPRRLSARALLDDGWSRIDLDRRGRTTLPDTGPELALQVRAGRSGKGRIADSAQISLAR